MVGFDVGLAVDVGFADGFGVGVMVVGFEVGLLVDGFDVTVLVVDDGILVVGFDDGILVRTVVWSSRKLLLLPRKKRDRDSTIERITRSGKWYRTRIESMVILFFV